MNVTISKVGRALGVAALGLGLLASASCEDVKDAACGDYECAEKGVADGNFAISGSVAIDSFFKSVVGFGGTATAVAADIKAELDGIQLAFGISDAELAAAGDLGGAISAKLDTTFKAKIKIDAQPAECKVDASVTAQATVDCQASANCTVDPGKASVSCMGKCTAEVSAEGKCDAEAKLQCEVSGPKLECKGECSGSCDVELTAAAACEGSCTGSCMLEVAASCEGTCEGMCDGTCEGDTDMGAGCNGKCNGMCQGSCELAAGGSCSGMCQGSCKVGGMAAVNCMGKCEGSCKAEAPEAGCTGGAKASCEFMADAMVECKGSCDGEFEPPKADCDASASCEASAKADAKFSAKCTPPSVDVTYEFTGAVDADVKAQFEFAISELKVRLPRLFASLKKSEIVLEAGLDLGDKGAAAVEGTIDGLASGDIDLGVAFKLGKCVPAQLKASAAVIKSAGAGLEAQVSGAVSVTAALGG